VVKGPFDGRHPPYERPIEPRHEPAERQVAGVVLKPIAPSGQPYTPRGGSAVGSALKSDYAVDSKTKAPDTGTVSTPMPVLTLSSGPGWHAVATRPEPQPSGGGGFRGLFHSSKPGGEAPVVMDRGGKPVAPEVRREQNRQVEFHGEQRNNAQPGSGTARSNASSAPAQQNHANSYQGSSHSAPAAPAPSAPAAPAAASHK